VSSAPNPDTAGQLHAAVDAFARTLHDYVDMAVGVVGESADATQAAADPRLDAADWQVALAGGRLDDALRAQLGVGAPLSMAWEPGDVEGSLPGEDDAPPDWEDFFLHVVVGTGPGTSPESLDHVLPHLDEAGARLVQALLEAGYVVPSFDTSRGLDAFEDDEEDE
jgi:hypothetical protein